MNPFSMGRRSFVRGLPLAGAAIALPAGVAIAASRAPITENPELVALGIDFDRFHAAFVAAEQRKRAARATYEAEAPAVPNELLISTPHGPFCGERETDVEGNAVYPPNAPDGHARPVRVISSTYYLGVEVQDYGPRTKLGKEARRRLAIAERYEAATKAAKESCGIAAAIEARFNAGEDLRHAGEKISETPARTPAGLALKARALLACSEIDEWAKVRAGLGWGPKLAEAVVAILADRGSA